MKEGTIRRAIASATLLLLLIVPPSRALLTEQTPERVLFLGYPASDPDLTVKIVRRKESFGLYAFRTGPHDGRMETREDFVGLVEGSFRGVELDTRAAAFLATWLMAHPVRRSLPAEHLGPYYRYRFEDASWTLSVTLRHPFLPSEAHPLPDEIISQFYAAHTEVSRMERLSRAIDAQHFALNDGLDLRRLAP